MREILFRGKTDDGEWVYGSFCMDAREQFNGLCGVDGFIRLYNKAKGKMQTYEVDRETVGQYTGLKDKNGKRIFEGDVCSFREWSKGEMCWVGKVHWEHQQFMISGGPNKECETMFELCLSRFIPENIEVIGNITDNPELLEKQPPSTN